MKTLRIIIAGSRGFTDYKLLEATLNSYISELYEKHIISQNDSIEIVSGTARGADRLGEKYASEHGYILRRFPADWNTYGKSAGYRRNAEMAQYAARSIGVLFAFWDEVSRGTKHMIDLAQRYGLVVNVIRYKDMI